jgi:hypothetical protein
VLAAGALAATTVGAADHLDAPGVQADGRTDINDLYAFQPPARPGRTVLVMTVNPGAGTISGTTFDPKADYTFHVDDDGDAVADREIEIDFGRVTRVGQFYDVRIDGRPVAVGRVGKEGWMPGPGRVRAGVFDDPFFFDLDGFRDGFQFTGTDFFAGLNVSAIVLEVPDRTLSKRNEIGVWATTSRDGRQIDRMGRPAINTALIPSDRKDAFNVGAPADDPAAFGDVVRATITQLSGDAAYAASLTDVLLPDVLTVDTSSAAGFLNGRKLADDVIDAELSLLTNGALTTDGVDANDVRFRTRFPYLAPAN